ncbi:2-dehydropantoate 2-reductase [Dyella soli]|uniref:2-dehydropantoate 2-reductase n=1 Tax=Dyella soli TaxID=522319 RepID=A0A4V2NL58_9GAMM|nr:2-dehydropantoate 2-reductase [Dyella soli]
MPRIAIYGAGSVGCYLGGRLAGHARVTFIGRPRVIDILRSRGLGWSDLHGRHGHVAAAALDLRSDPEGAADADLVLVTVKSSATETVARELARVAAPGVPVISFQNGLHNAEHLRKLLAAHRVCAGMVPFNVVQREPGVFHQGTDGELMVEADTALSPFLPVFAAAGLRLIQRDDMPAVQAAKLLFNLNNAINALSGLPLKQELSLREWRRCLALAQREALATFAVAGIRPTRLSPLPPAWLPRVLELPDAWFRRLAARLLAIDPLARSSMWEDLEAGRPTEVDVINGEIVRLAGVHGLRAPVNACLVALIRAAERERCPWTGAGLLQALRTAQ